METEVDFFRWQVTAVKVYLQQTCHLHRKPDLFKLCKLPQELQLETCYVNKWLWTVTCNIFFLNLSEFLFCLGNVKYLTPLIYAYLSRFLPSYLHCGTQHLSFEGLCLSMLLWKIFYLQLRQALLTKPEVVVPAVYVYPRDQYK